MSRPNPTPACTQPSPSPAGTESHLCALSLFDERGWGGSVGGAPRPPPLLLVALPLRAPGAVAEGFYLHVCT